MKKWPVVVLLVTLYAILFNVVMFNDVHRKVIITMFAISPFLLGYMAYVILKNDPVVEHRSVSSTELG